MFADPETGTLSPIRNLLAGMGTGVVASITAVTPTERIKTALIDDARNEKRFRSGLHATRVIWQEHGIMGLYRGVSASSLVLIARHTYLLIPAVRGNNTEASLRDCIPHGNLQHLERLREDEEY
jgi:hypothetical protein